MVGQAIQIKTTSKEPAEFRGAQGRVIRETGFGYMVVVTTDGREIILHPKSLRS
jgi:hypothetical protein